MVETQQQSLSKTLDVNRFREVGSKIAGLPDPAQFRKKVENDLWQTFTGSSNPDDEVEYEALPAESKSVIGYIEREDAEQSLPWWLASFEWKASSRGVKLPLETNDVVNQENELSQFKNFDPEATMIYKPKLQEDTIINVLESFNNLYEALDENIGIKEESTDLVPPSNIFEIEEGTIRTTDRFESWFNSLIQLSPPLSEEFTSLLMVNANVEREAINGVVPEDILEQLKELGFSGDRIFEEEYFDPLTNILDMGQVFDLVVPGSGEYDELSGLEGLFYEIWAENYQGDHEEVAEWIQNASGSHPDELKKGEEPVFGKVALLVPLRLKRKKPIYSTLGLYARSTNKSGYYQGHRGRRREINSIMESNGYLE